MLSAAAERGTMGEGRGKVAGASDQKLPAPTAVLCLNGRQLDLPCILRPGSSAIRYRAFLFATASPCCPDDHALQTNSLNHAMFEEWAKPFPNVKLCREASTCNEDRSGAVACIYLAVDHFKVRQQPHRVAPIADGMFHACCKRNPVSNTVLGLCHHGISGRRALSYGHSHPGGHLRSPMTS